MTLDPAPPRSAGSLSPAARVQTSRKDHREPALPDAPGDGRRRVELSAFLNACTLAHQGIARFSPEDAVTRRHQAEADPRIDSFVVTDADEIVGSATSRGHGDDEMKFFAPDEFDARSSRGRELPRAVRPALRGVAPGGRWTTTTWAAAAPGRACCRARLSGRPSLPQDGDRGRCGRGRTGHRGHRASGAGALAERPELGSALYMAWVAAFAGEWAQRRQRPRRRSGASGGTTRTSRPTRSTRRCGCVCDGDEVIGFCLCELSTAEAGAVGRIAGSASYRPVVAPASALRS